MLAPLPAHLPQAGPVLRDLLEGRRALFPCAHEIHGLKSKKVEAVEILTRYSNDAGILEPVGPLLRAECHTVEQRATLDMRCLETALEALSRSHGRWECAFVNLEPLTLEYPPFWDGFQEWIAHPGLRDTRLVLELTESCSLLELESLQEHSRRLRELGVRIAVDDLGSGVASLTHMARLAPDYIKADQSLVRLAHRRPYQAALLNALAHFARRMCVGFIAEGIETPEELQAVIDADVPWAQGYHFGEPALMG
jgi:EAL domain-containing protein (putative c-di-GMP-specific phosphodiesterase class I)